MANVIAMIASFGADDSPDCAMCNQIATKRNETKPNQTEREAKRILIEIPVAFASAADAHESAATFVERI